jgi:protein involved in polysaccharide export with SLBB domain
MALNAPGKAWTLTLLIALFAMRPMLGQQAATPPPPAASSPATGSYRLAAGDSIVIQFFYNPEFNTKAPIRPDGKISMPLIGEIEVANLSIDELTARLAELYKGTIRQPAVTIQVDTFANRRIFVGGEVTRPGMFALNGHETVLSAIYEAGGLTRGARRSEVTVIRRAETGIPEYIPVSLKGDGASKDAGVSAGFALQPLDVVLVHESGVSKADRAVDQYIRQMIPALLTGGFTYILNGASAFVP